VEEDEGEGTQYDDDEVDLDDEDEESLQVSRTGDVVGFMSKLFSR
jgi:hypothetical protein